MPISRKKKNIKSRRNHKRKSHKKSNRNRKMKFAMTYDQIPDYRRTKGTICENFRLFNENYDIYKKVCKDIRVYIPPPYSENDSKEILQRRINFYEDILECLDKRIQASRCYRFNTKDFRALSETDKKDIINHEKIINMYNEWVYKNYKDYVSSIIRLKDLNIREKERIRIEKLQTKQRELKEEKRIAYSSYRNPFQGLSE